MAFKQEDRTRNEFLKFYEDGIGSVGVRTKSAYKGVVSAIVVNESLNFANAVYTSGTLNVSEASKGLLFVDIDSTLDPTDVLIIFQVSDDGGDTWYTFKTDPLTELRYEDTATANGLKECFDIPLPGDDIRAIVSATGSTTTAYFDVTVKVQPYNL